MKFAIAPRIFKSAGKLPKSVAFLFELYQKYTSLLPVESSKPTRARKSKSSAQP
jgi:hypothetical protein